MDLKEKRASGYVVCAVARSGSGYLCQLLSSTGVLGRPAEYFNTAGRRRYYSPDYPSDPNEQIEAVLRIGSTPNGIYGVKIFPDQFNAMAPYRWTQRLPSLKYIQLVRNDLLGQAISLLRAEQTGRWKSSDAGSSQPRYDRRRIWRNMARLAEAEARWRVFFARNAIAPLKLCYETVVKDPQGAVDEVAEFVGLEHSAPIDRGKVDVAMLRDAASESWRRRFLEEPADTNEMDSLEGSLLDSLRSAAKRGLAASRRQYGRLTGR